MSFLYPHLDFVFFLFFFFFKYFKTILPLFLFFLFFFVILPDPDKSFNPVSFRAFIPCFLIDCFIGLLPFIASLTTEETNVFADGLATLNIKGSTLLAINENIPPPLLFLRAWEDLLGWNTLISSKPAPLCNGACDPTPVREVFEFGR